MYWSIQPGSHCHSLHLDHPFLSLQGSGTVSWLWITVESALENEDHKTDCVQSVSQHPQTDYCVSCQSCPQTYCDWVCQCQTGCPSFLTCHSFPTIQFIDNFEENNFLTNRHYFLFVLSILPHLCTLTTVLPWSKPWPVAELKIQHC